MKRRLLVWTTSLISIFLLSSHIILAGKDNLLWLVGLNPKFASLDRDTRIEITRRIMRKQCPDAFFSPCKVFSFDLTEISQIRAVAWSPHDSHQIALGTDDGNILIIKYDSKAKMWCQQAYFHASNYAIRSIAFHPHDSNCLAVASGTKILLWSYNEKERLWQHSATLENNYETISLVWNPNNRYQIASILLCNRLHNSGRFTIWHFNAEANKWSKNVSSCFYGSPCRNGIMWYPQRDLPTIVRANLSYKYLRSNLYLDNCTGTHLGEFGFMKTTDRKVCPHPHAMRRMISWGHGSVLSVWDSASRDYCHFKKMNTLNFRDKVLTACWNPHRNSQILTILRGNKVRIVDLCGMPQDISYQEGDLTFYQVAFILLFYAKAWQTRDNTFEYFAERANVCEDGWLRPKEKRITAGDLQEIYATFNIEIRKYLQQRYRLHLKRKRRSSI